MKTDVIIVGAGVLGTFHAYHALKQGLKVTLIEKDKQPRSATVRNFGQVVPSGMAQGKWQQYGIESTRIYKEIHSSFDISVKQEGSIYLASDEAECQLLEELASINKNNDYKSLLLTQSDCLARYPNLNKDYVKMGLLFPEEIGLDPRIMIHKVIAYQQEQMSLEYLPYTHIIECETSATGVTLKAADGRSFEAFKVIVCSGSDFKSLFPEVFQASDIEVSKLQMLRTKANLGLNLKGSILTGLTIRRYEAFRECASFDFLDNSHLNPNLKQLGIHILFKEADDGSVIIGDSHEYADAKDKDDLGFDLREDINELMLTEARAIFPIPKEAIAASWAGYYAQCKANNTGQSKDIFNEELLSNIHIVTAIGGKGMTASAGFAKENISKIFNKEK